MARDFIPMDDTRIYPPDEIEQRRLWHRMGYDDRELAVSRCDSLHGPVTTVTPLERRRGDEPIHSLALVLLWRLGELDADFDFRQSEFI
jgi:hypothetical protein